MSECIDAARSPTPIGTGEEACLSTESNAPQRALGRIVGRTDFAIPEEPAERGPAFEHVVHGLCHVGVARPFALCVAEPVLQIVHEWGDLCAAHSKPLLGWDSQDINFWTLSAAVAVRIMLPMVVFMLFMQQHVVRVLALRAVKE